MNKKILLMASILTCTCIIPLSAQAEIDPYNIGDTLVGTNHVTYSSTDPGNATGHVNVTNPDGSTQTIYYTYTMPENYELKNQPEDRINNTLDENNANKKTFSRYTLKYIWRSNI